MFNKTNKIAQEMDRCLEEIARGNMSIADCIKQNPHLFSELEPLLKTALEIQQIKIEKPRQGFERNSRIRLMNTIRRNDEAEKKPSVRMTRPLLTPALRRKIAGTLAGLAAFGMIFIQSTAASARALPGDTLYSVKIAYENTHLVLSNEVEDAKLNLSFAQNRLVEIEILAGRGDFSKMPIAIESFQRHILNAQQSILRISLKDRATFDQLSKQLNRTILLHKEMLLILQGSIPALEGAKLQSAINFTEKLPTFITPEIPQTGFLQ